MSTPLLLLNTGHNMPAVGLGTYKSEPGEIERAIKDALEVGYRHIDCAHMYQNESDIGVALKEKMADGTVAREEIFITSKLWNTYHKQDMVVPALRKSLKDLNLEYLDLFLIHWPYAFKEGDDLLPQVNGVMEYSSVDYLKTWKGMEECVSLGLVKSIGVSNFNSQQLTRILENCTIPPAVNQIECNPLLNQKKLREFCASKGIIVSGYCPLGRPAQTTGISGKPQSAILDPKVKEIAKKYGKSPAQVILGYLVSLGISVLPKSVTSSRIKENINIFDFQLNDEENAYMDSLNQNVRVCPSTEFQDHIYYPFHTEF